MFLTSYLVIKKNCSILKSSTEMKQKNRGKILIILRKFKLIGKYKHLACLVIKREVFREMQ